MVILERTLGRKGTLIEHFILFVSKLIVYKTFKIILDINKKKLA